MTGFTDRRRHGERPSPLARPSVSPSHPFSRHSHFRCSFSLFNFGDGVRRYKEARRATIALQAVVRMRKAQKLLAKRQQEAVKIQAVFRGWQRRGGQRRWVAIRVRVLIDGVERGDGMFRGGGGVLVVNAFWVVILMRRVWGGWREGGRCWMRNGRGGEGRGGACAGE